MAKQRSTAEGAESRRGKRRNPRNDSPNSPLRYSASSAVNAPVASAADQAVRDRGNAALKKQLNGEALTAAEANAIAKLERLTQREQLRTAYRRCSGEDLRGMVGCTRMQLTRYQSYGAPRNEDNTWNLGQFLPWLLEHERARVRKEGEKAVDALEVQRRIKAQRMELDLAEKREQVYPVDRFKQWIWDYYHGVSSRLQSWPRTVAHTREEELRLAEAMKKLLKSFDDELAGITGGRRQPTKVSPQRTQSTRRTAKPRGDSKQKPQPLSSVSSVSSVVGDPRP